MLQASLFSSLAKRRAWVVKSFLLFSEAVGKTRWSGRVRPEQGTSPASLREVQDVGLLLQAQRDSDLAIAEFRPICLADPINRADTGSFRWRTEERQLARYARTRVWI